MSDFVSLARPAFGINGHYMRRFFLFIVLSGLIWLMPDGAAAAEFKLKDGTVHKGNALTPTAKGIVIRLETGAFTSTIPWDKFSQETLKELVKIKGAKAYAEVLIEISVEDMKEEPDEAAPVAKAKRAIVVKEFPSPGRPAGKTGLIGAMFGTQIGFFILMVLYAGNIFAGFEVALYRNRPYAIVCGVAAVAPVIGPVVFLCLPYHHKAEEPEQPMEAAVEESTLDEIVEEAPVEAVAAEPAKPAPVIFKRGEFSFNRRFFETRFSNFFKVMPSEAEKNLILAIKCAKGDFVGKRISKISATELSLQLFTAGASSEEPILFNDIFEVQVRLKDEA